MADEPKMYTIRQLHENPVGVVNKIYQSREPAVIYRHGRLMVAMVPLPDGIEASEITAYLKEASFLEETKQLEETA